MRHSDLAQMSHSTNGNLERITVDKLDRAVSGDGDVALVDIANHVAMRMYRIKSRGRIASNGHELNKG